MCVFWSKGFAATSTEDLVSAMGIGRQSLYNAFGDKRRLYLEALRGYQRKTTGGHLSRLNSAASPIEGVINLLAGLVPDDDRLRGLGCMGIGSVAEFGASDPDLVEMREKDFPVLRDRLISRIREPGRYPRRCRKGGGAVRPA